MKKACFFIFIFITSFLYSQDKRTNQKLDNHLVYNIIFSAIKKKKENSPERLGNYQFYTYNKFYIDDLRLPDSLKNEYNEFLFLGETVTQSFFNKKYGKKNIVMASKISGIDNTFYELFNDNFIENEFPSVLSKKINSYHFRLIDSTFINSRKTFIINFYSKKNLLLNGRRGSLYIDAENYALVKYTGEDYRNTYTRTFEYNWELYKDIWYLKNKVNNIKFISPIILSNFLGNKFRNQKIEIHPVIVINTQVRDFNQNNIYNKKTYYKGYPYQLSPNIKNDSLINVLRESKLIPKESYTYSNHTFSTIFSVEKKINSFLNLKKGELELGQISFDLPNLISFNDYEGFRFQTGVKTNYKFNPHYSLNGYMAYGTKNGEFKGGGGIDFLINKNYDGKLSLKGVSDVNPSSKNLNRELQSFEQAKEYLNYTYNNIFYSYKKGEISYKQDFFNNLTTQMAFSYQSQRGEFNYSYNRNSPEQWYNLFTTNFHLKYSPFAKYMMTQRGKVTIEDKPVYFDFDYTTGFHDFNFQKFNLISNITLKNRLGTSNIVLNSGYISGKAPLWNLFGSFGNAKDGKTITNRFSPKGFQSFETMNPGEFFANKYVSLFFTHNFNVIQILNLSKLHLAFVYNAMIGNMEHKNLHSLYKYRVPVNIYQEAGIELNKIISSLGVGFYYRIGAYNEGELKKDLYLKITLSVF